MTWKVEFDEMILSNHLMWKSSYLLQFTCHIFIIIYLLLLIILFYFIILYYYKAKPKLRLRWGEPLYHLDTFKGIYEKDIVTGFQAENAWEKKIQNKNYQ